MIAVPNLNQNPGDATGSVLVVVVVAVVYLHDRLFFLISVSI